MGTQTDAAGCCAGEETEAPERGGKAESHTDGQGESAGGPGAPACLSRVTGPEGRGYSLRPSVALRGKHAPLEPPLRAGLAAG